MVFFSAIEECCSEHLGIYILSGFCGLNADKRDGCEPYVSHIHFDVIFSKNQRLFPHSLYGQESGYSLAAPPGSGSVTGLQSRAVRVSASWPSPWTCCWSYSGGGWQDLLPFWIQGLCSASFWPEATLVPGYIGLSTGQLITDLPVGGGKRECRCQRKGPWYIKKTQVPTSVLLRVLRGGKNKKYRIIILEFLIYLLMPIEYKTV